jgi:DNA-binding CsgD family transcriptional regulator
MEMEFSGHLRLSDVRKIFRLVSEVRELGSDLPTWRKHMLDSLRAIIGNDVGESGETIYRPGPTVVPESIVEDGGPSVREFAVFTAFLATSEPAHCPVFCSITRWHPGTHTQNYSGGCIDPVFDLQTWKSSAVIERRRAAGLGGFLYSQHALAGAKATHVIALDRKQGAPPFTDLQTRLLHLFHQELARLWHTPASEELRRLAPRLRQTLDGLLAGQSEKQVAAHLNLSSHTIHDYVKELHRRFHVASRGELFAHCSGLHLDFMPRLSVTHGGVPLASAPKRSPNSTKDIN